MRKCILSIRTALRAPAALLGCCAVALLFCCPTPAAAYHLPDSDQRKCYRDVSPYDEISCAGTAQDGAYIQNPLNHTDNGNITIS